MTLTKETIRAVKRTRDQAELELRLKAFENKFVVMWNTKGQGKTTSAIMLAHSLRELTGKPVVVVGTLIGLKDEFGESQFLSAEDFICQMRVVSSLAPELQDLNEDEIELLLLNARFCPNPEHDEEYVHLANGQWKHKDNVSEKATDNAPEWGEPCWTAQNGVILYRCIVLLDEGNEFTGGDAASNPLVKLFSKTIQMMRHMRITLIEMVPDVQDLAPKVRRQVDTYGKCLYFEKKGYIRISFDDEYQGVMRDAWKLRYDPTPYWDMFESFNILSIRQRNLNIKAIHI